MKITLALVALAISSNAAAQEAKAPAPAPVASPVPTTARCLLVSNAFAKHATEEKERSLAQSVLYFFIGRIDDRMTPEQLKAELAQEGPAITNENATPLMNACLHQVNAKAVILQSAAQELQKGK